jgi:hypothetical protein
MMEDKHVIWHYLLLIDYAKLFRESLIAWKLPFLTGEGASVGKLDVSL